MGIISRRHLLKTVTWRVIATTDTILLGWYISGDLTSGMYIGGFEIFTKMLLYYIHERLWFKSKFRNHKIRHILKTFSWRFIGTIDTILISWLIVKNLSSGIKIGGLEIITKMILYYLHEKLWYRINYGLDKNRKLIKKIFG